MQTPPNEPQAQLRWLVDRAQISEIRERILRREHEPCGVAGRLERRVEGGLTIATGADERHGVRRGITRAEQRPVGRRRHPERDGAHGGEGVPVERASDDVDAARMTSEDAVELGAWT